MAYLKSENVIVYPASNRINNARSIYTSETNLTNPLRVGDSVESYVISYDSGNLEVVLGGYYFKLNDISSLISTSTEIVANDDVYLYLCTRETQDTEVINKESKSQNSFLNLIGKDGSTNLDITIDQIKYFSGLKIINLNDLSESVSNKSNLNNHLRQGKNYTPGSITINGVVTYYLNCEYWFKIGTKNSDGILEIDKEAFIRYDQSHIGIKEVIEGKEIIKRIPQITTMSASEFSEKGYPDPAQKGDILIVYKD